MISRPGLLLLAVVALIPSACHDTVRSSSGGSGSTTEVPATAATTTTSTTTTTATTSPVGPAIVFSAQGSALDAYATTRPFVMQTVVQSPAADRDGVDVSGQICFDPTDPRRFVAVDLTAAADGQAGWGIFELSGRAPGKLSANELARLVPTFQPSNGSPKPFGCDFLPDGRLLTTDTGSSAPAAPTGQLIEWFPPFDQDTVDSCKVRTTLAEPAAVLVDGDNVYVAESGGRGVASFVTSTLPTSDLASGGCARHDTTGAPLAYGAVQTGWLQGAAASWLSRAAAVVRAVNGDFYVSSPRTGVIAEVTRAGAFVRLVLAPPAGEKLGRLPFSTGTPLGLGVDPDGTLYYADPGLVVRSGKIVAGLRTGTLRRITFVGGVPQRPQVVDSGLQAPTGIGIWTPSS